MNFAENVVRLWEAYPDLCLVLRACDDVEEARVKVPEFIISELDRVDRNHESIHPLEYYNMKMCCEVFQSLLERRSESLSNFSLLGALWALARTMSVEDELSTAFFEDVRHLFLGIRGQSNIYNHTRLPLFLSLEGREAAVLRSIDLEEMAGEVAAGVGRYPTGMDKAVIARRQKNVQRILKVFKATESDWCQHIWHLRHLITDAKTLARLVRISPEEREAITLARKHRLPFGITPYYVSLMDYESSRKRDHAVRAQVIPPLSYVEEMIKRREECQLSSDFMLERDTSPVPLVTRRYPNIAILKPYNTCSQICVYCQRNWEIDDVYSPKAMASSKMIDDALDYFRENKGIDEILITGGDPLIMKDSVFLEVLKKVARLAHIRRIRIGTRTPVVLPMRITDELVEGIARHNIPGYREIALVTHFEHVYEITPEAVTAVQKFRKRGISVYNQLVYTTENCRRFEAVALRKLLRLAGVDPYYTFNTKGKDETKDYRVPIARLLQEIKEEARLTPGLVRTDEPVYNVPKLGKNHLRAWQHRTMISILPDGRRVYEFLPWETKIALADTYIDTDVPIHDFLEAMARRGEDPLDYESIYYYY